MKKKEEPEPQSTAAGNSSDGFDIPTITEIASNAVKEVNRRKEITELVELQRKIDEAKKQLRYMAPDESGDDDDFINLHHQNDGDDIVTANEQIPNPDQSEQTGNNDKSKSKRIPITFDADQNREHDDRSDDRNKRDVVGRGEDRRTEDHRTEVRRTEDRRTEDRRIEDRHTDDRRPEDRRTDDRRPEDRRTEDRRPEDRRTDDRRMNDRQRDRVEPREKERRSVLERLGNRSGVENGNTPNQSIQKRIEQKMYVPVFRRNEQSQPSVVNEKDNESRGREKTRENVPRDRLHLRERVRERERDRTGRVTERDNKRDSDFDRNRDVDAKEDKPAAVNTSARVGSRICVAPPKPDYDEDLIEVPVNSVVKVQPRPTIPKRNQPCKNLLLRAMAEAQQSVATSKTREPVLREEKPRLEQRPSIKQRLNTSFKISFSNNEAKRNLSKDNIIVKVPNSNIDDLVEVVADDVDEEEEEEDEEYCPVPAHPQIDGIEYEYVPQSLSESYDDDEEVINADTQFVVTLDKFQNRRKRFANYTITDASFGVEENQPSLRKRGRIEKVLKTKPASASPLRTEIGQKVNKLIIRNDTDDEEELRKDVENSMKTTRRKRRNLSPIQFDLATPKVEGPKSSDKSTTPERAPDGKSNKAKCAKTTDDTHKVNDEKEDKGEVTKITVGDGQKIKTSTVSGRKYENLPSCKCEVCTAPTNTSEQF